jgi:hypothetical protein
MKEFVTKTHYPIEILDEDVDDGTMPANVNELADKVVGHKIVKTEYVKRLHDRWSIAPKKSLQITLDNGTAVILKDNDDCCAFTELQSFLLNPEKVDHIITGVGTTNNYETWHIYADFGDVLELQVGWSCGNLGYYGYGFIIDVEQIEDKDTGAN